ncbi:hypothetical protein [Chryseobacterium indoltheticum]|uniref:Uncharacterized protein n=1 Tax=Chryseobacterium indoltheticum TaxID=254 RepID=A0A381F4K2_9FLAO|nr:hypothetical protein [Chryseobacterium indoltheticum]AZA74972.1 hypothetical protein EG358_14890 [Chryseobacterium indoltheticum]SIQ60494.1 hypothetical protein SAMN05421682_106216 [Chryseobacterium indoltheticum]SUX41427.1 Uncharacterised protein [Chryseobacterium indoltheticum]
MKLNRNSKKVSVFLFYELLTLKLHNDKLYLYGSVNPWVLLASGEITEVKEVINKGGKKVGQKGEFTTIAGEQIEGILIGTGRGTRKSKFVRAIEDGTQDADEFLKLADDSARQQLIRGVDAFNYEEAVNDMVKKLLILLKTEAVLLKMPESIWLKSLNRLTT